MAGADHYDWRMLLARAAQAIEASDVEPTMTEVATFLNIPRSGVSQGFKREFGISTGDLPSLPKSVKARLEAHALQHPERAPGILSYAGIDPATVIHLLQRRSMRLSELAERLDRGRLTVEHAIEGMQADGIMVQIEEDETVSLPNYLPADPLPTLQDLPSRKIKFALLSDPHIGSKFSQVSALKAFLRKAKEVHGVRTNLWAGDAVAGVGVYRGQHNELYAHGAQDQVDAFVNTIPYDSEVQNILLGGNHDYSLYKISGTDPIRMICNQRPDFKYAGYDQADVPLTEDEAGNVATSILLWHPTGGVPYALSYRGQKFAAEVSRDELTNVVMEKKPSPTVRFIAWGHLHVSDMFPHGPIWVIGPGCFEGRNSYLKAHGLFPVIQGVVVEADLTPSGLIQELTIRPIPFVEQENDYRCSWIPDNAREREEIDVVYKYQPTRAEELKAD